MRRVQLGHRSFFVAGDGVSLNIDRTETSGDPGLIAGEDLHRLEAALEAVSRLELRHDLQAVTLRAP